MKLFTSKYYVNVCGNIETAGLPEQCRSNPPAPAYQFRQNSQCLYLGLLANQTIYPVDPGNSSAGIRVVYHNVVYHNVVYHNGANITGYQGNQQDPTTDYGSVGIGDQVQGRPVVKGSAVGDGPNSRAIIIDIICDPSAGVGKPERAFEWLTLTYRITWRSAHGCPVSTSTSPCPGPPFEPNWRNLAFRPRPAWFDDVKFGIFLHWGLFSVPSFGNEWYWEKLESGVPDVVNFHNRVYGCSGVMPDKFRCTGEKFLYNDFPPLFHAELFEPDAWATLFKQAGAKYVVLTSKHHEGWCNFPSAQHWNWNSMDVGPHRDLVGELTDSVRAAGLHMGLYHSLREWYNPLFLQDNDNNCTNPQFVDQVLMPTLKDMTTRYKPEVIWSDGASGDNPCSSDSVKYWKAPEFLSWLYNESPVRDTVLVNDRWGSASGGDYNSGPDRWVPGKLVSEKWESCFTVQKGSWGYDRREGIENFYNTTSLIFQLVNTVSCNGNLLLNVGPTADGRIVPAFEERLLGIGQWLQVNGEAIYGTKPWSFQNDTAAERIWYTQSKTTGDAYATSFDWPVEVAGKPGDVVLSQIMNAGSNITVTMLGMNGTLAASQSPDGFHITVPDVDVTSLPTSHAWVFKLSGIRC